MTELAEATLHARRCLAVRLLEWACRDGRVGKDDERYTAVTEGRDRTPAQQQVYSSCADLGHWLLFRLGVRSQWLNRQEHRGWRSRVNVNRFYPPPIGSNVCAVQLGVIPVHLEGGDIVVVGTTEDKKLHVVCVVDEQVCTADDGTTHRVLYTAEYGASGMRVGGIGGHLVTHEPFDGRHIGKRQIRVVLPLENVLSDALDHGLLVEPDPPEEIT